MNKKLLRPLWVPLATIGLVAGVAGCQPGHNEPITLNLYIDGSDRAPDHLNEELAVAYQCNMLLAPADHLNIFVFAHGCEPLYSAGKLNSRKEFYNALGSKLSDNEDSLWKPGTLAPQVLQDVAAHIDTCRTISVLIGDGGFEDMGHKAIVQLNEAVKLLASSRRDSNVLMLGVDPAWREQWETWLKPLGSTRFAVRGFVDSMDAASNAVKTAHSDGGSI